MNMDIQGYLDMAVDYIITYSPTILIGIAILWIGLKIISAVLRSIDNVMKSRGVDETLRPFLHNLINWTLKFALFIAVAQQIGINTMSFVAVFGAAGLAIGLALQGTLSNFASGVMLLIFRPFKVGDFVEGAGHMGTVEAIGIFVTELRSPQNRLIIIPNSAIGSGSITNYSNADKIQVRIAVGVSYDSDIKKSRDVILQSISTDSRIMTNEPKEVLVSELADSSVNLSVRFWVDPNDYWPTFFDHLEGVKIALDNAGIEIPFPQRVVHMQNN